MKMGIGGLGVSYHNFRRPNMIFNSLIKQIRYISLSARVYYLAIMKTNNMCVSLPHQFQIAPIATGLNKSE